MSHATTSVTPRTYVVGLGQTVAGDDDVGLAVIRELQSHRLPDACELRPLAHPMELVALLEGGNRVVLVDALLALPAGRVLEVALEELSQRALQPASSHGMGAVQAIQLAQALMPAMPSLPLRVVGITIEPISRYRIGLSEAVATAVPVAAETVLSLLRD